MSAVELTMREVKKLSVAWQRKARIRRSMQKLKTWQDSVRFTTDWQPPRMPDDLTKSVNFALIQV
jgi:hypothetical protein